MTSLVKSEFVRMLKDLYGESQDNRVNAIFYFQRGEHRGYCEGAQISPEKLRARVFEALREKGVRREKMIKEIIEETKSALS